MMGYILSEYILRNFGLKDKFFERKISKISNQKFISNKILNIQNKLSKLKINPIDYKNWIVAYDNSMNSFLALEYRIKLSECCYKTLPYMNIKDFLENKIKNSVLIYDVGFESDKLKNTIKELIKKNNFNPLIKTNKNIPYLVDQHLLEK